VTSNVKNQIMTDNKHCWDTAAYRLLTVQQVLSF